jgi:leucyl aminopeptidase
MTLNISARAADLGALESPLLVLALSSGATLPEGLDVVDRATAGALRRFVERRDFRGSRDELLHLSGTTGGIQRVLLIGMGSAADRVTALRRAAALAGRQANKLGVGRMAFWAGARAPAETEAITLGLIAGSWDFKEMKTAPPAEEQRTPLEEAVIVGADAGAVATGRAIGEGHSLARRLGMLPGNVCTPEYLADTAREIAQRHNMKVTVLGRAEMEREKMESFLCVAWGTPQDPKLIALEYRKGPANASPVVLVGKGLCFDSGGISIKPAQGMEWMKFDMCGAAGVLGAMETIGRLQLPINVVGLIGSTTNMPSGTAVKPGDVVQASNGKYIEIINTDAEGRLVLADALAYAVAEIKPDVLVDVATLTGAMKISLGQRTGGLFATNDALAEMLTAAGTAAGEPLWRMPLVDDYEERLESRVADADNAAGGPGAITAALFLRHFTGGLPWAHLDIASVGDSPVDSFEWTSGATGFGARALLHWLELREPLAGVEA